ncbi:Flagellar hook-associated protein 2 [compost metagenome]
MLRDLMSQLNSWMNTSIGTTKGLNLLSNIGLEIDKGVTSASLMTGKITFDSSVFKAKMLEDPTGVQKLLGGTITTSTGGETTTTTGIGGLFKNNLQDWNKSVDGLIASKIKGYDSEISYLSESIQNLSDRLDRREESLKKQYANLEVIMSSLNNQKSYVSSILASFTKSSD